MYLKFLVENVGDISNVKFNASTSKYELSIICDFTEVQQYNVTTLPYEKGQLSDLVIKDESDYKFRQMPPDVFSVNQNLFRKYVNNIESNNDLLMGSSGGDLTLSISTIIQI